MRILISGASGFVGGHFTRRLLAEHSVTGVDIRYPSFPVAGMAECVVDDLRRFIKLRQVDDFDLIIHCAAVVGGRLHIDGDPLAVATNLALEADFFNWLVRGKTKKRVVYFSSSAIYPVELQRRKSHLALSESLVDLSSTRFSTPDQTYGFAKFAGEVLAQRAVKDYGAEVVIYRPFSGYGEDQSLDYPFPSIIKRVASHMTPVTVWGSGDQVRDFIHIDDIVDAVMLTYARLPAGTTLNLGTGIATSFNDLATMAIAAEGKLNPTGYQSFITNDPSKPEGVHYRIADTFRMEKWYKPKISLQQGIERALTAARVTA
jgi:nucleoside-diphosphate-sugar epimerase